MRNLAVGLMLLRAVLVSGSVACDAGPAEGSEGFSGRISADAGYMTSTDQLKTAEFDQRQPQRNP